MDPFQGSMGPQDWPLTPTYDGGEIAKDSTMCEGRMKEVEDSH